jgi:Ca-activated chloride channel family protein
MKTGLAWVAALAAILCLGAGLVAGQTSATNNVAIKGVVRDSDGKPIEGVRMSLLNVSSGAQPRPVTTTTNAKGEYTFASLTPGTYTVMAELAGFQAARYSKLALVARQTLQLDFKMRDGAVSSPLELTLNPPKEEPKQTAALPPLPPLPNLPAPPAAPRPPVDPFGVPNPAPSTPPSRGERGADGQQQGRGGNQANNNQANNNNRNRLSDLAGAAVNGGAAQASRGGGPGAGAPGGGAGGGFGGAARGGGGRGAAPGLPAAGPGVATIVPMPVDRTDRVVILSSPSLNRTSTETYERIADNPFIAVNQEPLATLAIDVDTASYSNVRRFLSQNQLPPRDAVRIEELVNYFSYDYPFGSSEHPITANIETAATPWNPTHRLVRVGIKAKDVLVGTKRSNLVFLIDVSGSMSSTERLPLLKSGMNMFIDKLTENDTVSIVTYSGNSGIALNPTNGSLKDNIRRVVDSLRAEGSTNGGAGIQTAYDLAAANFIRGGVNRVILMTDGDFNVGVTSQNELISMIEDKARGGTFLSVLGVGTGNLRDNTMEKLADKGHGNYAYVDSLSEARKVLVDEMASTFITVAKDVKIQVEFNPTLVVGYRLIGYENRLLAASDFNNDRKDGGDMGSGHTVTALFEVVPRGAEINPIGGDPLRFQPVVERTPAPVATPDKTPAANSKELLNLKIRYKDPEGSESKLIEFPLVDRGQQFASASSEFRFAAAVAAFGMILRDSPFKGSATWDLVNSIATNSRGSDRDGYREEFVRLAEKARQLWRPNSVFFGETILR